MATLSYSLEAFEYGLVRIAAGATYAVFPTRGPAIPPAGTAFDGSLAPPPSTDSGWIFPKSNTRQIVILNTSANPVLVGTQFAGLGSQFTTLSQPWGTGDYLRSGPPPFRIIQEGLNTTRLPGNGSLTWDLDSYEGRGNWDAVPNIGGAAQLPCTLIFFFGIGGAAATLDITYINTYRAF